MAAQPSSLITIPAGERSPLVMEMFTDDRLWAITPRAIRAMVRAASHPDFPAAFDAVAARVGQPIEGGRGAENRDGTAILDVNGPLFRYRSIWTWLLGGTAVEDMAIGLRAALDDPSVNSIVLNVNSPGGQIDGINEFANMVRAANSTKPVTAYVGALAGSGAYWLASAAGKIVADETAQLGSIGVLATVVDDSAADEKRGIKRFDIVSSQSPLKRTDPGTDEGRAQLQTMVDQMAQVFIAKVAQFRGTSEAKVQTEFGRGAVMSARDAVTVGMADELGSLEGLLNSQSDDSGVRRISDKPGLRVAAPVPSPAGSGQPNGMGSTLDPSPRVAAPAAADPFDEEELEEGTENTELNNDPAHCPNSEGCGNGEEDEEEDEGEGTEQSPDESSIPEGVSQVAQPTETTQPAAPAAAPAAAAPQPSANTVERQRIAAILNCEEARGREELARYLALETNHSLAGAQKILKAAPVAQTQPAPNRLDAAMGQVPNPKVGVPGDQHDDDSPAAEVQRVLSFIPKDRLRQHVRAN